MPNKAHGGLGKGLGALLKGAEMSSAAQDKVQEIPIESIQANPYQPRRDFDKAAMDDLRDSIRQYGVLQPILVRRLEHQRYELIAGERRFRAGKLAGLKKIPAVVREYSDAQISEVALIENLQREDLNAMEEARAYQHLMESFQLTQEELSQKVGRSRSHIANFLRLLRLSPKVQECLSNGTLNMGQAKPLVALENPALQEEAARYISTEELSARQSEALVKRLQQDPDSLKDEGRNKGEGTGKEKPVRPKTNRVEKPSDVFVAEAEDKLKMLFGTQVRIRPGKKKSRIEIDFYAPEDLDRIIETLTAKKQEAIEQKKEALRNFSLHRQFTV